MGALAAAGARVKLLSRRTRNAHGEHATDPRHPWLVSLYRHQILHGA